MAASAIVACSTWVPRGVANENPDKVELSPDDLQQMIAAAKQKLAAAGQDTTADDVALAGMDDQDDDSWEDMDGSNNEDDEEAGGQSESEAVAHARKASAAIKAQALDAGEAEAADDAEEDELAEYNLDAYDEEEEDMAFGGAAGLGNLTYHTSNTEDPYIMINDDDDDVDDFRVKPTDNLIVVGRSEEALSHIEVHLWNEDEDNLFVHHDILLDTFPLCVEWIGYDPGSENQRGNLVAVGSMQPDIDIWDLDVIDAPEPIATLASLGPSKKKKNGKKTKRKVVGHSAEVLGLAWNSQQGNLLASSSADTTVRLWDLDVGTSIRAYEHHSAPVENIAWNKEIASVLLTSGHDGMCAVFDTRAPDEMAKWEFGSDVECMTWHPQDAACFLAGTSDGNVYCCDSRNPGQIVFTLSAHDSGVSCMSMSHHVPGLLVTGSSDQKLKIWDVLNNSPSIVHSRDAAMGPIYTMGFCPDSPFAMCVGGHVGGLQVVNLAETGAIRRHFASRHKEGAAKAEQLVQAREAEAEARVALGLPEQHDDGFDESDEEDWAEIMDNLSIANEKKGKTRSNETSTTAATAAVKAKAKAKKQKSKKSGKK